LALDGQLVSVGDIQAGAQAPPVAGPSKNPQVQVLVFRYTATVAPGDSALHVVHDGRRPLWFVAVRWPRQAGMTHLTRRPLPSNRRPMPSCLWKPAGPSGP